MLIAGLGALLLAPGLESLAQTPSPAGQGAAAGEQAQGKSAGTADTWPREVVILKNGTDLGDFLKQIKQPDLIITRPPPGSLPPAAQPPGTGIAATPEHVTSAIKVQGRLDESLAELRVDLVLNLLSPEVRWVPLGIDGPIVGEARDGDQPLRAAPHPAVSGKPGCTAPECIECGWP